jgi:hypothetical protein
MSLAFAEGVITNLRRERKVLLAPEEGDAIWERIHRELRGVPYGPTGVTTVYFDRPGFPLARRAIAMSADCLKVRVKEYLPDREGDRTRVVLEAKRERASLTTKERIWMPRSWVRAALAGAGPIGLSVKDPRLAPVVAVQYQRLVFQTVESWRVTLDRGVTFHEVSWDALAADDRPAATRLGPRCGAEAAVVLELKYVGDDVPQWLGALVEDRARPFSKFVRAMARLEAREAIEG